MYLWLAAFRAMPGKESQAVVAARAVAEAITKGLAPASPGRVLSERLGDHSTIYYALDVESLADVDRAYVWASEDQDFQAANRRLSESGTVVPGSRHDTLLCYQ